MIKVVLYKASCLDPRFKTFSCTQQEVGDMILDEVVEPMEEDTSAADHCQTTVTH